MSCYISELDVSLNEAEEQNLKKRGFNIIDGALNEGAGGNTIYLWYKNGSVPITKVQVSFNKEMANDLANAGYTKIDKDLNAGAGVGSLYLWYSKGSGPRVYNTPIVKMSVTVQGNNEAAKFGFRWERVACDLNRKAQGNSIHLWLQREKQTYICDVAVTDSYGSDSDLFGSGYTRMDEDINRGVGKATVFIWYRQTTDPEKALKDLQVSINNDQFLDYQQQDYQQVVVVGTGGQKVCMWYKKEGPNQPIKTIALLLNPALVPDYQKAGLIVIQKNLNTGTKGFTVFLCVYQ